MSLAQQLLNPLFGTEYINKVLGYSPIAYWPLWEASGSVAGCQVNSAQNGSYTGVTLGQSGIGDGKTCPLFDGANDYANMFSATFQGAFDGAEGSILLWTKVTNVGVWTDGSLDRWIMFLVDGGNLIAISKDAVNNRILYQYVAGGTSESIVKAAVTETGFMCFGLTWSASAGANGEVKAYYYFDGSGGQTGATQTTLGAWAGNLAANGAVIGAQNPIPANPSNGYEAHVAVWDSAQPKSVFDALAMV